jgi:hypothetical protein
MYIGRPYCALSRETRLKVSRRKRLRNVLAAAMEEIAGTYLQNANHAARAHFIYRMASTASVGGVLISSGETDYSAADGCVGVLGHDKTQVAGEAHTVTYSVVVVATAGGKNHEDAAALSADFRKAPRHSPKLPSMKK